MAIVWQHCNMVIWQPCVVLLASTIAREENRTQSDRQRNDCARARVSENFGAPAKKKSFFLLLLLFWPAKVRRESACSPVTSIEKPLKEKVPFVYTCSQIRERVCVCRREYENERVCTTHKPSGGCAFPILSCFHWQEQQY